MSCLPLWLPMQSSILTSRPSAPSLEPEIAAGSTISRCGPAYPAAHPHRLPDPRSARLLHPRFLQRSMVVCHPHSSTFLVSRTTNPRRRVRLPPGMPHTGKSSPKQHSHGRKGRIWHCDTRPKFRKAGSRMKCGRIHLAQMKRHQPWSFDPA